MAMGDIKTGETKWRYLSCAALDRMPLTRHAAWSSSEEAVGVCLVKLVTDHLRKRKFWMGLNKGIKETKAGSSTKFWIRIDFVETLYEGVFEL